MKANFCTICIIILLCLLNVEIISQNLNAEQDKAGQLAQQFYTQQNGSLGNGKTPDEINATTSQFLIGHEEGEYFGHSVANAGDVNGDGYEDIIIGAYRYNSATGRVYIYFGGPTMDNIADITMNGEAINYYFGISVSSAGDVNGDGYGDVIIGSNGQLKAYIYFGGPQMDNTADITLAGWSGAVFFGSTVSKAGDVNGDGYSDVVVGAYGYASKGRAYIYFGGAVMDTTADVTMTGNADDNFGYTVSTAGDVNGDGYSDVIIGAMKYNNYTGKAYIFLGGASMDAAADLTFSGENINNYFGRSVSEAGDLNGDGFGDVIIGAYGFNSNRGKTYIYYGGSSMDNISDITMVGETAGDDLGFSCAAAGDVNGDGYYDVIVSAPSYEVSIGRAYVFYGGESMDNRADQIMTGEAASGYFGVSASGAGDINDDGYDDILVGADILNLNRGKVYIFKNNFIGKDTPDLFFTEENTNDFFGGSISEAGDVNGDGYVDIIVGALGNNSFTGKAYVYFGGPIMDNIPDVTLTGEAANDHFGVSVASAGDVNGDGYADVIVGADYGGDSKRGKAYIYFGGSVMDSAVDVTLTGESAFDYFGISVSSAGDVNGDGYSDVIVGALTIGAGKAYIYYGGIPMDGTADVPLFGGSNTFFGFSVSTAGDVNGDGYSDVIVGEFDEIASLKYRIKTYIYYGGPSMSGVANIIISGELFGTPAPDLAKVSTAGDVNGDGYSDIIVGNGVYGDGSYEGKIYLYYGGSSMDTTADITMNGEAAGDYFGRTLAAAGDVNGDGFDDVIVGTNKTNGKAYIFFGGSVMDNIADITMSGDAGSFYFGRSVSSAGDINGDGYDDVVIGGFGYQSYTGRAYLFLSSAIPTKPRLIAIKDVPADQGGFVNLAWTRSGYDVKGSDKITGYKVYRSVPPSLGGLAWEFLTTVNAEAWSKYSYTAAAPNDSMSGNSGTYFYRIKAETSSNNEFWLSNIESGHSADNLGPAGVLLFKATNNGGSIALSWKPNYEKDLYGYYIYRSDQSTIDPGAVGPLAIVVDDTTYTDNNPPSGTFNYFIRAKDIHSNFSILSASLNNPLPVELSAFTAVVYGGGVTLNWKTETELNTYKFEVERKQTEEWIVAGEVAASGNSNSPKNYSFRDLPTKADKYTYRLKILNNDGQFGYSGEIEVEIGLPSQFSLSQNYPNPFNPATQIEFSLPAATRVLLEVFNILGEKVVTLVNEEKAAGSYKVEFSGKGLTSGIYIYSIKTTENSALRKMLLLK